MHVDLIYQRDQQFTRLAKDNPLYSPYDLRRRRPMPITIQYQISLIAKYKEDLDQMMTNWMVHCRPDLYVKWWHPRDKSMPLQSQILWNHSLSYKKPEQQPTSKFQYQATTNFTFKTWVFPGLDYKEDQFNTDEDGIIKYFNWFPTSINYTGEQQIEGYPTIGQIGSAGGLFAVPTNMQFENDGSDIDGIKQGKYYINNLTQSPKQLYNGDNGIKDIEATADILTKDTFENQIKWEDYQAYCQFDNITNERAGIKAVYFSGGYPLSSMLVTQNPSGDFLFQHFCSQGNTKLDKISGFHGDIQEDLFGICFTESLIPKISYNFENKIFDVKAQINSARYYMRLQSVITKQSILQEVEITSDKRINKDLKLKITRQIDSNFEVIKNKHKDQTVNIKILNNSGFKNNYEPIQFLFETIEQKRKLLHFKDLIEKTWDELEIYPCDQNRKRINNIQQYDKKIQHYRLSSSNKLFKSSIKKYANIEDFDTFVIRDEFIKNNIEYTLIANNYLYFVLSDEDIYDWGIISLPRFNTGNYPIFKSLYPTGQLTYGIGIDCNIACVIK